MCKIIRSVREFIYIIQKLYASIVEYHYTILIFFNFDIKCNWKLVYKFLSELCLKFSKTFIVSKFIGISFSIISFVSFILIFPNYYFFLYEGKVILISFPQVSLLRSFHPILVVSSELISRNHIMRKPSPNCPTTQPRQPLLGRRKLILLG